jgi:hypothetical protein
LSQSRERVETYGVPTRLAISPSQPSRHASASSAAPSPVTCSVMRSGSRQRSMPSSTARRSSSGSDRTSLPFAYSTSKT